MIKICITCGKEYKDSHPRRKYCSRECIKWGKGFFKPKPRLSSQKLIFFDDGSYGILIPLSRGYEAIIDPEDFHKVNLWRWQIFERRGLFYARAHIKENGKWKGILLHRYILGFDKPSPLIDHKNRNGLDNRRSNLRIATPRQNAYNRKVKQISTSGFSGVHYHKGNNFIKRWMAVISINGKRKHLGAFMTKEEAINVRLEAEKKYYGEFTLQEHIQEAELRSDSTH